MKYRGSLIALRMAGRSFVFGIDRCLTRLVDPNAQHVRVTTDGTIFDVFLPRPSRCIDGNDNYLATVLARIATFGVHLLPRLCNSSVVALA